MTDESDFAKLKVELDAAVRPGGRVWFVTLVGELNDINPSSPAELLATDVCSWPSWPEFRGMSKSVRLRWMRAALIEIDHRRAQADVQEIIEEQEAGDDDAVEMLVDVFPQNIVLRSRLTKAQKQRWIKLARLAGKGKFDECALDQEQSARVALVCGVPVHPLPGVYFVTFDREFVKIGFATDITARMRALQTAMPQPLHLMLALPGTLKDERDLHRRFAADRVQGEWFRLSPEIEAFIESEKSNVSGAKIG